MKTSRLHKVIKRFVNEKETTENKVETRKHTIR